MEPDRLNSPDTSAILFEVLGHQLQFSQEKNCRRGRFCPSKLRGKRVVELGAGCGVAGFGMALLGCDVTSTDQTEVLPLLIRNVERNTSRIVQMNSGSDSFGSIQVAELNWGHEDHIKAVDPPFDYIIGTDVVYAEHLLEPLLQTILALSGPKTTILLGYEIRSTNVHEKMMEMWKRNFEVKIVPRAKMDNKYQHGSIQLYIMSPKPLERMKITRECVDQPIEEVETGPIKNGSDEDCDASCGVDEVNEVEVENASGRINNPQDEKLSEWESRRYGAMAARLLRDIKIS